MSSGGTFYSRRSVRLGGYDYSRCGLYYVTVCTDKFICHFGEVSNGKMLLNEIGGIVRDEWLRTGELRRNVGLDEFVVMPNHLHGIIVLGSDAPLGHGTPCPYGGGRDVGFKGAFGRPVSGSLSVIVGSFKSAVSKRVNRITAMRSGGGQNGRRMKFWQRNYYDHVIRSQNDLGRVRDYIRRNPGRWDDDEKNLTRLER